MNRLITFVLFVGLLVGSVFSVSNASEVTITAVDSTVFRGTDTIRTGTTFKIYVGFLSTSTGGNIVGLTTGFRVYTPNAATWTTTNIDSVVLSGSTAVIGKTLFEGVYQLPKFSVDGALSDTVGLGLITFDPVNPARGIPPNVQYDSAFVITVGPIPAGQLAGNHNQTICIDSSFFRPAGDWLWGDSANNGIIPDWGGPYCWTLWDEATPVGEDGGKLPGKFSLSQNYPNPFNPTTEIAFDIREKSQVTLNIYNVLGQQVRMLVDEELSAGSYNRVWDGRDDHGKQVTTGVYFYKLQAGSWTETKKMTFLK